MRIGLSVLAATAVVTLATPAAAAEPQDLFTYFRKVCLETDGDPAKSAKVSKELGFAEKPQAPRTVKDGQEIHALVLMAGEDIFVHTYGQVAYPASGGIIHNCVITGGGRDEAAWSQVKSIAPGEPAELEPTRAAFFSRLKTSGRTPLSPAEAERPAVVASGELEILAVDFAKGSTSLGLSRFRAPK